MLWYWLPAGEYRPRNRGIDVEDSCYHLVILVSCVWWFLVLLSVLAGLWPCGRFVPEFLHGGKVPVPDQASTQDWNLPDR